MRTFIKTSWAWGLLLLAIMVWGTGAWWVMQIDSMSTEREVALSAAADQQIKDTQALRTRALISETQSARARLAALSRVDVVEAAKQIESAGIPAGIKFHVRDASLETVSAKNASPLQPVAFSVDTDGTFVALIRAIGLLRSLPFPLQITQLDLSTTPLDSSKKQGALPQWHASIRLRLLTTAPLPS